MTRIAENVQGKPLLLCLSSLAELRFLRERVLSTRYAVTSIATLAELEALPESSAFALLVLCHSITYRECLDAMEAAHRRWPAVKVLVITAPFAGCQWQGVDAWVNGVDGPKAMFATIDELLDSPARFSGTVRETVLQ